jgi:signal peptidase I
MLPMSRRPFPSPLTVAIGRSPKRTLLRAAVLAAVCFIVFTFVLLPVRLRGTSMEPTYTDGVLNFVNALRYRLRTPRRGDIVAIRMAGRHVMLFKRIVGLPGERVAFRDGALLIDGREVDEPYVHHRAAWDMEEVTVGPNEYFVVGDNRRGSIEAHALGRVQRGRIVGGPLF